MRVGYSTVQSYLVDYIVLKQDDQTHRFPTILKHHIGHRQAAGQKNKEMSLYNSMQIITDIVLIFSDEKQTRDRCSKAKIVIANPHFCEQNKHLLEGDGFLDLIC